MTRLLFGLTALSLCVAAAGADGTKPGKPTLQPSSLAVSRKLDDKKIRFTSDSISMQLVLSFPGKQLLGVDSAKSKVSELKDDKGNSLLPKGFFQPNFTQNFIADDRAAMTVGVYSGTSPGKGATRIHLKGNLVVRCGLNEKTTDEKEVEMKNNAEAKLGDYALKVTQDKGFGGYGATFSITAPSPVVKSVTVKDADGKAIELMQGFSTGFGKTWTYHYTLRKPAAKAKVSVTYFTKDELVTVPVDVTLSLGL